MKKYGIKTVALGLAAMMGLGSAIGVSAFLSNKEAKEVKADTSGYEVIIAGYKENGTLTQNGELLASGKKIYDRADKKGGYVSYDINADESITIVFNNFNFTGKTVCEESEGTAGCKMFYLYAPTAKVNIVINGTNTITTNEMTVNTWTISNFAFDTRADELTFTGEGSLTYNCTVAAKNNNYGFYASDGSNVVNLDGPTLTFNAGPAGNEYNHGGNATGARFGTGCDFNLISGTLIGKGNTAISGTNTGGNYVGDSIGIAMYDWNTISGGKLVGIAGKCGDDDNAKSAGIYIGNRTYLEGGEIEGTGGEIGTGANSISAGIYTSSYSANLRINKSVGTLNAKAYKNGSEKHVAISGNIINSVKGSAWDNIAGSGTASTIDVHTSVSSPYAVPTSYKKIYFEGQSIKYTATGYNAAYDGENHSISVTVTEPTSGYKIQYGTDGSTFVDTKPEYKDVCNQTVYFKISHNDYDPVIGSATVVITKADSTFTTNPTLASNLKYTGEEQDLISDLGETDCGEAQFKVEGGSYSTESPTKTEVGTYKVYYRIIGDGNHNDKAETLLGSVTIGKADIVSHSVSTVGTYKYTGSGMAPVVETHAVTVGDKEAFFSYSKTEGDYESQVPLFTDAGTYTIYYKVSAQSHNDAFGSFQFTIGKADAPVVTKEDQKPTAISGLIYSGSEQEVVSAPVAPLTSADGYVGIRYSIKSVNSAEWSDWNDEIPTVIDAGYYEVRFYYVGDSNHNDTAPVVVSGIYLDKAPSTIEEAPTIIENIKYTSEGQELIVAGVTHDGKFLYSLDGVNYSEDIPTAVNVGTYTVYYMVEGDSNHYDSEPLTLTVKIGENDKTKLQEKIAEADSFYNDILSDYPTIAKTLKDAIDAAKEVKNNPNVTVKQIEDAINALNAALVKAKQDHNDIKDVVEAIKNIGKVENTEECVNKIDTAKTGYDDLSDYQKSLVDNYQVLVDDEHVHTALVKIDAIGEVGYNYESEEAIKEAREYYDSLTDAQKEQLGDVPFKVLTTAEADYANSEKTANNWLIVLYIIAGILIACGIFFIIFLLLKRRKDDDDDDENNENNPNVKKQKPVKAMSVGGLLPIVILVSHWTDQPFVIAYILFGIAALIWLAVLVIAILRKKGVVAKAKAAPKTKEAAPEAKAALATVSTSSEDDEQVTYTDEKGNIFQIRFIKSFMAKLIQSPDETKKYYEELKKEVLSYKNVNSRVSWHYDSLTSSRNPVVKFAIRGKTLCVYYPLNADDYNDTKYKVEKSESKRFEDVSCMYRIKNDRRKDYAKELIAEVALKLGLEKGKEAHESYANLPYEENKPLIARGLIKEQKIQVKASEAPTILESKVNAEGDEIIVQKDAKGNIFEIRFIKSFLAKLSQSSDEVKDYYNALKNYALSYKNVNARTSWHYDSINYGRNQVLKFAIRGKTLCVYFALSANELDEKYKVESAKSKKFSEVPCLYRIKNDRRFSYAKELIDMLMLKLGANKGKELNDDYRMPYETTKALLAKGLIKEVKSSVTPKEKPAIEVKHVTKVSAEEADSLMSDEVAKTMIEEDKDSKEHTGKKGIINLDDLEENFSDGDTITIEALQEKKLVAKDVGRVKLLARGTLDKKFHVDLQDYSLQAVKMVLLVGGTIKVAK